MGYCRKLIFPLMFSERRKTTTKRQFDRMVTIFEENKNLEMANGRKYGGDKFWKFVANELNALGPPIKDGTGWKKVWADFKSTLKKKIINNRRGYGIAEGELKGFASLEQRVFELLNMPLPTTEAQATETCETQHSPTKDESGRYVSSRPKVALPPQAKEHAENTKNGDNEYEQKNDSDESTSKNSIHQLKLLQQIKHNDIEEKKYALKLQELELRRDELDLKKKDFEFRKDIAYKNLDLKKQLLYLKRDIANRELELKTAICNKELEIRLEMLAIEKNRNQ